ncbi:MAG: hypothetical protein ACEY3K_09110, partial [Wolbachia sp.]
YYQEVIYMLSIILYHAIFDTFNTYAPVSRRTVRKVEWAASELLVKYFSNVSVQRSGRKWLNKQNR